LTTARPIPEPDEYTAPYFEGAARGLLLIQRCRDCAAFLAPGATVCSECLSESLDWVQASGRATLHTFGLMHQPYHPGFLGALPYNLVEVELAEGPRLNAAVRGISSDELKVGMPLAVSFENIGGVRVPVFVARPG
jgi:uncharacterized OB-fold protein